MPKSKKKSESVNTTAAERLRERKRLAQERRERRRRMRQWLYLVAAALIAVLVIGSFVVSALPGRTPQPSGENPGTRVALMPILYPPSNHIPDGSSFDNYSTTPPTSGPHYNTPAEWGVYDKEVRDEAVVHSMEHAGVVISYNLDDPAALNQLKSIVESYPRQPCYLILRPYSKIEKGKVALTAWGVMDVMDGVDEQRIRRFIDAYRGNGGPGGNAPELFPC